VIEIRTIMKDLSGEEKMPRIIPVQRAIIFELSCLISGSAPTLPIDLLERTQHAFKNVLNLEAIEGAGGVEKGPLIEGRLVKNPLLRLGIRRDKFVACAVPALGPRCLTDILELRLFGGGCNSRIC
jgi:hypothetical protein